MTDEITHQGLGHAKLHVSIDVSVTGVINLRYQDLEPGLDDQCMKMGWPIGVSVLRYQQSSDNTVRGKGIADHLDGAEPETSVGICRELAAQIHVGLIRVLIFIESGRGSVPDIDLGTDNRITVRINDLAGHQERFARCV